MFDNAAAAVAGFGCKSLQSVCDTAGCILSSKLGCIVRAQLLNKVLQDVLRCRMYEV